MHADAPRRARVTENNFPAGSMDGDGWTGMQRAQRVRTVCGPTSGMLTVFVKAAGMGTPASPEHECVALAAIVPCVALSCATCMSLAS